MRLVRQSGMAGAAVAAIVALAALPAATGASSFPLGSGVGLMQTPGCVPVTAAECGSVQVPLFRSKPAGPTIDVAYVLVRHRDPALPTARGTVVFNPGGPGTDVIGRAANWTGLLAGLLGDHDVLLIDPRGVGRSHPRSCGSTEVPATRSRFVRAIARCG